MRLRIAGAVGIGLLAVGLGIARLGLLGWLIGQVFAGRDLCELVPPIAADRRWSWCCAASPSTGARVVAHETAARVQKQLRRTIYDQIAALGPGTVGRQRSGALTLSLIDGVEQLETYFGQFLPQFLIALLSPLLIFAVVAFIDLPVALVMLGFALVALFAPALWHKCDVAELAAPRRRPTPRFAAEFLDSIQGLATLKAFGQGRRAPTSSRSRRASCSAAPCGCWAPTRWPAASPTPRSPAAPPTALIYGAWRVEAGAMALAGAADHPDAGHRDLPADARAAHACCTRAWSACRPRRASTRILDDKPPVADAPPAHARQGRWRRPSRSRTCASPIPARARTVHDGLDLPRRGRRAARHGRPVGRRQVVDRAPAAALLRSRRAAASCSAATTCARCPSRRSARMIAVVNQDTFLFHGTVEENIRLGRPDATQRRARGRRARRQHPRLHPGPAAGLRDRRSARRASSSPAASASASRSPARCCATRRSWCSTRRCPRSMPRTRR